MRLREWAWAPALIAAGILLPGLTAPTVQADTRTDTLAAAVCADLDGVTA